MTVQIYQDNDFLKKYEERAKIHRLVPFKKIIDLIGEVKGKQILDLGCGTGDLSVMLYEKGASLTGIDISEKWIGQCKKQYIRKISDNFCFLQMSGTDLKLADKTFDVVVMCAVLLNVDSIEEVEKIFAEISRVLKKDGVLIFTDLNPILIMSDKVRNRYIRHNDNFSYFKDADQYTAVIVLKDGQNIEFTNRHWTLETYSRLLEKCGMAIITIAEPTYGQDAPDYLQDYPIPEYILFKCKKLS